MWDHPNGCGYGMKPKLHGLYHGMTFFRLSDWDVDAIPSWDEDT
jgi:hypothetical protein